MNSVRDRYAPESAASNVTPAEGVRARSWVFYGVLILLSSAILFVRFPPADLTGWISATLGVPVGVPYLLVSALLFLAARVIRSGSSKTRKLARITAICAGVMALIGVLTVTTPMP